MRVAWSFSLIVVRPNKSRSSVELNYRDHWLSSGIVSISPVRYQPASHDHPGAQGRGVILLRLCSTTL